MKAQRYTVKNQNGEIVYKCVTEHLSHEYVMSQLMERYKLDNRPYKIFHNDKLVKRLNYIHDKTKNKHQILDTETGDIFSDCYDLADHLGISYTQAKRKAYTMFRYRLLSSK